MMNGLKFDKDMNMGLNDLKPMEIDGDQIDDRFITLAIVMSTIEGRSRIYNIKN